VEAGKALRCPRGCQQIPAGVGAKAGPNRRVGACVTLVTQRLPAHLFLTCFSRRTPTWHAHRRAAGAAWSTASFVDVRKSLSPGVRTGRASVTCVDSDGGSAQADLAASAPWRPISIGSSIGSALPASHQPRSCPPSHPRVTPGTTHTPPRLLRCGCRRSRATLRAARPARECFGR
jgi:hypothetical protein